MLQSNVEDCPSVGVLECSQVTRPAIDRSLPVPRHSAVIPLRSSFLNDAHNGRAILPLTYKYSRNIPLVITFDHVSVASCTSALVQIANPRRESFPAFVLPIDTRRQLAALSSSHPCTKLILTFRLIAAFASSIEPST